MTKQLAGAGKDGLMQHGATTGHDGKDEFKTEGERQVTNASCAAIQSVSAVVQCTGPLAPLGGERTSRERKGGKVPCPHSLAQLPFTAAVSAPWPWRALSTCDIFCQCRAHAHKTQQLQAQHSRETREVREIAEIRLKEADKE